MNLLHMLKIERFHDFCQANLKSDFVKMGSSSAGEKQN